MNNFNSTDTYSIKSKSSGRSLDVRQDGEFTGHLILWDYYGAANQQFQFQQVGDKVKIRSKKTQKRLTVAANLHQNGVPVLEESYEGISGQ